MSATAVGFCLSAVWLIPFLILQFKDGGRLDALVEVHTHERELWRAERQILQARSLRPVAGASASAGARVQLSEEQHDAKLAELRRLAGVPSAPVDPPDLRARIVLTDL